MKVVDLFREMPFGWPMPDGPLVRQWIAWAEAAGDDIQAALDTCPHPGAMVVLVASIALRSGDAELLKWHAEQVHRFVARASLDPLIEGKAILPDVPREMIVRAFTRLDGTETLTPSGRSEAAVPPGLAAADSAMRAGTPARSVSELFAKAHMESWDQDRLDAELRLLLPAGRRGNLDR